MLITLSCAPSASMATREAPGPHRRFGLVFIPRLGSNQTPQQRQKDSEDPSCIPGTPSSTARGSLKTWLLSTQDFCSWVGELNAQRGPLLQGWLSAVVKEQVRCSDLDLVISYGWLGWPAFALAKCRTVAQDLRKRWAASFCSVAASVLRCCL